MELKQVLGASKISLLAFLLTFAHFVNAQSVSVLTYNTWLKPGIVGSKAPKERRELIDDFILSQDADVVCLQEVFRSVHYKRFAKLLSKKYPYRTAKTKGALLKVGSGLIVFSKYPIKKAIFKKYKKCKGADCFSRKGALFVEIEGPDKKEFTIINTHLQSGGKHFAVRETQLKAISEEIEELGIDKDSAFLVGDLNIDYYKSETNNLKKYFDLEKIETLFLGDRRYSSDSYTNTFKRKDKSKERKLLDYVLPLGTGVQEIHILKPMEHLKKYGLSDLSDHYPVKSTIQL